MKTLIGTLLLISSVSYAQDFDATDALLRVLPARDYSGRTSDGDLCQVSVRNLSNRIAVIVSSNGQTKRGEVFRGATYRWNPANRSFLASALTTTLDGSRENIVKTIAVTDASQYVVVSDVVTDDRNTSESLLECIVSL